MKAPGKGSLMGWLKDFMFQHVWGMITCREFETFIQAYHDDELPNAQKSVFEWHLRLCRECSEYLAAYRRTIELGQAVFASPDEAVPEEVPEELVKAILDARRQ